MKAEEVLPIHLKILKFKLWMERRRKNLQEELSNEVAGHSVELLIVSHASDRNKVLRLRVFSCL